MAINNPFYGFPFIELFQTLIPDLLLSLTFFISLSYAVFSGRFDKQRPAIGMSVAIGSALSIGLVYWEYNSGWSIRNLGPIASGLALMAIGITIFQAFRKLGGGIAGGAAALGITLLIGNTLGTGFPLKRSITGMIIFIAAIVAVASFILKHKQVFPENTATANTRGPLPSKTPIPKLSLKDIYQDREVSRQLASNLTSAKDQSQQLQETPQLAGQVMGTLNQLLPDEGWLTNQLAELRKKAWIIRNGHIHKIETLSSSLHSIPVNKRKKIASALALYYKELKLDNRLDRLDTLIANSELKIRQLTQAAMESVKNHQFKRITELLDNAAKLQKHNTYLMRSIGKTEKKLESLTKRVIKEL